MVAHLAEWNSLSYSEGADAYRRPAGRGNKKAPSGTKGASLDAFGASV